MQEEKCIRNPEIVSNDELTNIFSQVGAKYGFDNVTAKFVALRDFKVKWQRTYRWADFAVSDYASEAPKEALSGLAETIFKKIKGEPADYPEAFCEYVTKDEFLARWQPTYVKRSKSVLRSPIGKSKNLEEAYKRIVDNGYSPKVDGVILTWTKDETFGFSGYSSALMKAIIVNKALDEVDVPDYVIDYTVLDQLTKIREGVNRFCCRNGVSDEEGQKIREAFPQRKEAEDWIQKKYVRF